MLPTLHYRVEATINGGEIFACGFPSAASAPLSREEEQKQLLKLFNAEGKASRKIEKSFKSRDFEFVLTNGAIGRVIAEENGRIWIQHNADINPGNSGGPLIDEDGIVLGINTLRATKASGIFFSLSAFQLKEELQENVPNIVWE